MKCPYCGNTETKVIDSRPTDDGNTIRRRRECEICSKRFTTYEKLEEVVIMVIKKDGSRERFDRNKVLNGIIKACEKRPVSLAKMEMVVKESRDLENRLSEMSQIAYCDALTNISNRRYLEEKLQEALRLWEEERRSFVGVMCDIEFVVLI